MRWLLLLLVCACSTGFVTMPEETGKVTALFCDQTNCEEAFIALARDSNVKCAMYHPTESIATSIDGLIVDGSHPMKGAVVEDKSGLMHNKFCVINESIVWTGSWNPAQGQTIANNVVIIESRTLAAAYRAEYDELAKGVFQGGKRGPAKVLFNHNLTEAYFCPEDNCQERILRAIGQAKESIHVMAYSFTDDSIGKLLESKATEGFDVRVVFDPRKDKYSEYDRLKNHSIVAKNHHKTFIIDGTTVITGSMNPTRNGNENNDENIIILREANVAQSFEREFTRIWSTN